ncbi:hypothetical protein BT63DRAFT_409703 [Microthyrium microscopicum]|uniref:CNH domain-containing protein n=1 Tax=Microthyrium microscopicum TaxID=703497 RepID=A0A6A6UK26_9PEZI|nr:hypothetical protein BT63DRAFT_409703 [Microthyrium microscopicum]
MEEPLETGTYVLRSLIKNIDLTADGESETVRITCVELWEENLYIGTSAGEVLHHVCFPPDPNSPNEEPSFILASRQKPPTLQTTGQGIQQILILPAVGKACVISNNTLNFYTLPELSPGYANVNPLTCGWVGGVDLEADPKDPAEGVAVMLGLRSKIRLVDVGRQSPKRFQDIDFGGCQTSVRRGDFACVADSRSYALLDVQQQRKVPLFPISSVDDHSPDLSSTFSDEASIGSGTLSRTMSPDPLRNTIQQERGHRKSSSLNVFRKDGEGLGADLLRPGSLQRYGFDSPLSRRNGSRRVSAADLLPDTSPRPELGKPLPSLPPGSFDSRPGSTSPSKPIVRLKPLIASPNSQLFLLVTGTAVDEPCVGMFVNLDGELDRGTIEFPNYPDALVVDGNGLNMASSMAGEEMGDEGYVLAVVQRSTFQGPKKDIEIQRWDIEAGEGARAKEWLNITTIYPSAVEESIGLRSIMAPVSIGMPEVAYKLAMKPIHLAAGSVTKPEPNTKREREEEDFVQRLCRFNSQIAFWHGDQISWIVRNPTVMKLDSRLRLAQATSIGSDALISPQRDLIQNIFNDIRDARTTNELDYFSLRYIRQKAALLLFMDLIVQTMANVVVSEQEKQYTEQALVESEVDPRIILAFLPTIQDEVIQSNEGIWVQGGLRTLLETFFSQNDLNKLPTTIHGPYGENILFVVKHFLQIWRRKKGNPSVTDGGQVFPTVDAALVHILLLIDGEESSGTSSSGSVRTELYAVVDNGVEGFERVVTLLEQFKRLYVLSRLYQKKKLLSMVLATWKRILSGEEDAGGEFVEGELELRKYLSKLKDRKLVIEYATWLAARNPKLGVQVFADENSRVTIPTNEALLILRQSAPNAVKDYLEFLVFGKKQSQHINELIAYYLDIVLDELKDSPESRSILIQSYETYRALTPPKPTYRQFITDNAVQAEWWHSRLRLLHLLGSSHGPAASYDVEKILTRLEPYIHELVPEMIILNGRQGYHKEALHLLTQGLGDFDTAISYCLLGGSSIFRPPSGFVPEDSLPTRDEQAILFDFLLLEFLAIENVSDRIERTGELLERFGSWFDASYVLNLLPDDWAVNVFSAFLVNSLQRLVRDKREATMTRALSMAQNLRVNDQFIEKSKEIGPILIDSEVKSP